LDSTGRSPTTSTEKSPAACSDLKRLRIDVERKLFVEEVDVLDEPPGEVLLLARPDRSERYSLNTVDRFDGQWRFRC
jgi:hypothetical protein